jgi:hypothetical protein
VVAVMVRHKRSGIEAAIDDSDFDRGKHFFDPETGAQLDADSGRELTYEDAGYEIVQQHPSGLPYEGKRGQKAKAEPKRSEPKRGRSRAKAASRPTRSEEPTRDPLAATTEPAAERVDADRE